MLKGFGNFLLKELKELIRDPKILLAMVIVPLIMFPILGAILNFSMQAAQETATKITVLIINRDGGENSTRFMEYLKASMKVFTVNVSKIEDAVPLLTEYNATEIIEIPETFSQCLAAEENVTIRVYSVFSGAGLFEGAGSSILDGLVEQFNRELAPNLVISAKSAIIKGQIVENVDSRMLGSLMLSQAITMPITIMILLSYSMQIAATSVAMEKEEKTLETLLTLPMDRFAILMGKLSGSIIVAAIGAVAYMAGFNYYMSSFMSTISIGANVDLVSLGLAPSLFGYLLLGLSLFVTLLSALALAVIISAFAEDVRGAQAIVGNIYPLIFIPSLLLMYLDVNALPIALRIFIYAIPFSHPIIAAKAVTMGDNLTAALGVVYVAAFTIIIMYVASRLFATEKILTAKLRFKGLRRRKRVTTEELQ
ncbi:MAG: ABC transporter permease [Candidatus Bathyarchaeota archaeon]|nr:ABC transporter permease [Candidatus Bathyarchaeota archaeon]